MTESERTKRMISFRILTEDTEREITNAVLAAIPEADVEEIGDIFFSFYCEAEIAVSTAHGCMLIRIFDDEYFFVYPIPLHDGADPLSAVDEIRLYTIKEEIPLIFLDVPSEELGALMAAFSYAEALERDAERDSCTVVVQSEIGMLEAIPSESDGEISLSALRDSDGEEHARLARDKELNKYWGYDYSADMPDAEGVDFLRVAEGELERGAALSLAVRCRDSFIGEAVIYAPDLRGGAECALRLLPEYQGRGFGRISLSLLIRIARDIGIIHLRARVLNENAPSLAIFRKQMQICEENEKFTEFYINL